MFVATEGTAALSRAILPAPRELACRDDQPNIAAFYHHVPCIVAGIRRHRIHNCDTRTNEADLIYSRAESVARTRWRPRGQSALDLFAAARLRSVGGSKICVLRVVRCFGVSISSRTSFGIGPELTANLGRF